MSKMFSPPKAPTVVMTTAAPVVTATPVTTPATTQSQMPTPCGAAGCRSGAGDARPRSRHHYDAEGYRHHDCHNDDAGREAGN